MGKTGVVLTNLKGLISPDPSLSWGIIRIEDPCIVCSDKNIEWIGPRRLLPRHYDNYPQINGEQAWATPGFVDPHTHLLFEGDRSSEQSLRLKGATYQEIAKTGGGILKTVLATRQSSLEQLLKSARLRLQQFRSSGVLHLEVKTGYGLDLETELKLCQAYNILQKEGWGLDVTLLLAHDLPKEFKTHEEFTSAIVSEWMPEIYRQFPSLIQYTDVFIEQGYFSPAHALKIFNKGLEFAWRPRVHADEFSDSGGALLSAQIGAVTADHLMFVNPEGIRAMAKHKVIPVLLPATTLFLGMQTYAPARTMIEEGCPIAIASDFNPGSSPCINPLLVLQLACLNLKLSFEEAFIASTANAAKSLAQEKLGYLTEGHSSSFLLWNIQQPEELVYWLGSDIKPKIFEASKACH